MIGRTISHYGSLTKGERGIGAAHVSHEVDTAYRGEREGVYDLQTNQHRSRGEVAIRS